MSFEYHKFNQKALLILALNALEKMNDIYQNVYFKDFYFSEEEVETMKQEYKTFSQNELNVRADGCIAVFDFLFLMSQKLYNNQPLTELEYTVLSRYTVLSEYYYQEGIYL